MVLGSGSWSAEALARCPSRHAGLKARKKAAGDWWARGVKLYQRGLYNKAIEAWQCSNKLMPTPDALFNIAKAAELAGRWQLAVDSYSGFLRQTPNSPKARYARRALLRLADKVRARRPPVSRPTERRIITRPQGSPNRGSQASRGPRRFTAIEAGVGIEIWGRRLSFTNLEGEPGQTLLYETNTPLRSVSLTVEVYPGAFVTGHRILANVGLGFFFRTAMGVKSQREGDPTPISTTIQRAGGQLIYRWNIKNKPESAVLKFSLGVEMMEYSFGENLERVAGVTYVAFKPAVKAVLPLGTERVKVGLWFAGLAVITFGQIESAYHYGNAKGGGVEVGLEVDVRLFWKIHLVAGFHTTWFFVRFSQVGMQLVDYQYTADSARDGYFGGYLLAAFYY